MSYSPAQPVPSNGVDYGDLPPALIKAIQAGQDGGASTAGSGVVLPPGVVAAIDKSNQEALQRVKETNDPPSSIEGGQQDAPVEGDDSADAASPSETAAAMTTTTTTQKSGADVSDAEGDDADDGDAGAGAGAGAVDKEDYGGIPPALVRALEDGDQDQGSSQGDADQEGVPKQGEENAEKQGVPQQLALMQALRQGRTVVGGSGAMGGSFDVAGGSMSPVSTAVGEGVGLDGGEPVGVDTASRPLVEMSFVPQSL